MLNDVIDRLSYLVNYFSTRKDSNEKKLRPVPKKNSQVQGARNQPLGAHAASDEKFVAVPPSYSEAVHIDEPIQYVQVEASDSVLSF